MKRILNGFKSQFKSHFQRNKTHISINKQRCLRFQQPKRFCQKVESKIEASLENPPTSLDSNSSAAFVPKVYPRMLVNFEMDRISQKHFSQPLNFLIEQDGLDVFLNKLRSIHSWDATKMEGLGFYSAALSQHTPKLHKEMIQRADDLLYNVFSNNQNDWKTLLSLGLTNPSQIADILDVFSSIEQQPSSEQEMFWALEMINEGILSSVETGSYAKEHIPILSYHLRESLSLEHYKFPRQIEVVRALETLRHHDSKGPKIGSQLSSDWTDPDWLTLMAYSPIEFAYVFPESEVRRIREELLRLGEAFPETYWPLIISLANWNHTLGYVWCETPSEFKHINSLMLSLGAETQWSHNLSKRIALLSMYFDFGFLLQKLDKIPRLDFYVSQHDFLEGLVNYQINPSKEMATICREIPSLTNPLSSQFNSVEEKENLDFVSSFKDSPIKIVASSVPFLDVLTQTRLEADLNSSADILEVGCGTGHTALSMNYPSHNYQSNMINSYLAIDNCLSRLGQAEWQRRKVSKLNPELPQPNLQFKLGNLFELTPKNCGKQFDTIVANNVLHYTPSIAEGVAKLSSLLKPKGFLELSLLSEPAQKQFRYFQAFLSNKIGSSPLFEVAEDRSWSRLLRTPSTRELRLARSLIIEEFKPKDLTNMITLHDFRNLLFHPHVHTVSDWQSMVGMCADNGLTISRLLPSTAKDESTFDAQNVEAQETVTQLLQFSEDNPSHGRYHLIFFKNPELNK